MLYGSVPNLQIFFFFKYGFWNRKLSKVWNAKWLMGKSHAVGTNRFGFIWVSSHAKREFLVEVMLLKFCICTAHVLFCLFLFICLFGFFLNVVSLFYFVVFWYLFLSHLNILFQKETDHSLCNSLYAFIGTVRPSQICTSWRISPDKRIKI